MTQTWRPRGPCAHLRRLIYASTKQAVSRWVRRESVTGKWADEGIALNAVGPGVVTTPMKTEALATGAARARFDAAVPMPLNYHHSAESVADLLLWLTSSANMHCCGQTIYCDGGAEVVLRGENFGAGTADQIAKRHDSVGVWSSAARSASAHH
ncbi:SDR family oxidoreductase [Mycobacterium sp. CBMA293]|uniref:SDR family oxidoreductase n=1 Tax=unclassified Mycolicibacterium TaxID=2636767 RepID=UPI0012DC8557|nr:MULTISPECIES: SDR family oxidoreductase [unclassified Mycolicibacterium]MUL49393.1 SDR family oxidoreductase [Mycolicibacterium sp. CBMA 360]MUL62569.1 SDR family oxidoreductase [Mycolicibacterium sp. CBMA 335]MUL69021.1 SDR family oxidoreductase [Mycolicibacterium sp. CBMA 311]MUL96960.1 SDR family oxidoreductase [Mycolicibacterium sp. CBMA 230]MUM04002.1 hypothetical protein [Mycolicibacterium sp. CBMA 213]